MTCSICTMYMWSPFMYVLSTVADERYALMKDFRFPDCGHVFCQSCIQDLFEITQRNFCQVHPHFHWEEHIFMPEEIQDMVINDHMQCQELIALSVKICSAAGRPIYSCPKCCSIVKNPLLEVFKIKSAIWTVASAQGENSPQRGSGSRNSQSRNRDLGGRVNPWDQIFPPKVLIWMVHLTFKTL